VDERLREVIGELEPDAIVEDNVCAFPALPACGRPWVRIVSCNPLEIRDPDVPPPFSGYPADDRSGWEPYWAEFRRTHADMHAAFDEFCRERGAPGLPELEFMHVSPYANLYVYPDEVDYARLRPLHGWTNLQASVRATDAAWELPPELEGDAPLIYLSLGSLGSADVGLMQALIDSLAATRLRVIVSLGPQHDQLRLGPNMAGAEFLPQTSVLPLVDAVITHGGNNTVTECLHAGKPMVLLPLFWDQYDNAQRMHETGLGMRLPTYTHAPEQLSGALETLLADNALARRLDGISRRLQAAPGTVTAADAIERVVAAASPA
jgi:MGT family glycosyltransferase